VVAKNAKTRLIRRPEEGELYKEQGKYFEDVVENTKADNRQIILIIDEAHKSKNTKLAQDIIDLIDPKIIFQITATPTAEDKSKVFELKSYC
jgi:type III restriction enzyme